MLWPTNEQSIVFITFLGSFFPILLNALHGMANVDPVLVRAARSLGPGGGGVVPEVYLPATLPQNLHRPYRRRWVWPGCR